MATTFLEPGGDADFQSPPATTNGFWSLQNGATVVLATDFVHGSHIKSIKFGASGTSQDVSTVTGVCADAGTRISLYLYLVALPSATATLFAPRTAANAQTMNIRLTSTGVLQLWNGTTAQIGSNGSTLSTGVWYRLSIAYTITSTTVNRFELFKDGVSDISVTNATVAVIVTSILRIGNINGNGTLDFRTSDHYVDNSSSLTDTGNVWVTAKRPFSNGTTNGFTTQIGSGGSGYGTGHAPQVNERPLSVTNGWSMIGAGSAITEEYNIEGQSVGDMNITGKTIVDYTGWVSASAALSETGSIVVNNVTSNIALTSTNTLFKQIAGSATYPAGTGTDIGVITSTTLTTVSLYECGVIVAFIGPPVVASTTVSPLSLLGAG